MLVIKYALITAAIGLLASAGAVLAFDLYRAVRSLVPPPIRWRMAGRLAILAWLPLLPALANDARVAVEGVPAVRV
jgi:hypothetical protein